MTTTSPTASFRNLHQPGNPFILANAWDRGSAKVLAACGAQAIASTSAGHAFTLGVKDGGDISREQAIAHARDLAEATSLPVSADLENGFGDSSRQVVKTVHQAGAAGLAGCCIEDTQLPGKKPYDFTLAVERIEAAAEAARALAEDFVLTARADGVWTGCYDVDEAIRRIQAFEKVGADVLYVPVLPAMEDLKRVCSAVDGPVNALVAGSFCRYSVEDFAGVGAARLSLGSSLARMVQAAVVEAAEAMFGEGDFSTFADGISGARIEALFDRVNSSL